MQIRAQLIDRIDAYVRATRMSDRKFSLAVAKDHRVIARLRRGKSLRLTTIEQIERYMAEHPPEAA